MATKFNEHFSTVAERLRSTLPNIPLNMDQVINFVNSKKDPDVSFAIPPITEVQVIKSVLTRHRVLIRSAPDYCGLLLPKLLHLLSGSLITPSRLACSLSTGKLQRLLLCTRVESLMMYRITGQFQSCPYYLK